MIQITTDQKPRKKAHTIQPGEKYGRLTVLEFAHRGAGSRSYYVCRCECGKEVVVSGSGMRYGDHRSCGCLAQENRLRKGKFGTHFMSDTPEHEAYMKARRRCQNETDKAFKYYGGRGIRFNYSSFVEFFSDVGPRPTPEHSLDRKNVNGNYEPGNCRWATKEEQQRNKRSNYRILISGEWKTAAELSEMSGVGAQTLQARHRRGWCEVCLLLPAGSRCSHATEALWAKKVFYICLILQSN